MSNSAIIIAVPVVLSAAIAFAITTLQKPVAAPTVDNSMAIDELKKELADLRERTRTMTGELERVRSTPVQADRQQMPTVSDEQVTASVKRWFQEHGGAKAMEAAGIKGVEVAEKFDAKTTWELLHGTTAWDQDKASAWKKAYDSGHFEELVAWFEQQAKDRPTDASAQLELAGAYVSQMQFEPTKYTLAHKADECYDKVLAFDANNWDARFSKAVGYTFWPDFTGKPQEAIGHFEKLIDQQRTMPASANQAQTYLMLGNLLDAKGNKDRAREIWQQGLQRHPDSKELKGRVGG